MSRSLAWLICCASCSSPIPKRVFTPRPVDPDAIRKACALEVSCFANPPITPAGRCVADFENGLATGEGIFFGPSADDLVRYISCAGAASGCTDALDCASTHHGPDWCSLNTNAGCEGDLLIGCIAGWGIEQLDCTSIGMHCATADGHASCTDGASCDPAQRSYCDGNEYVRCNSATKLESRVDCSPYGWSCQASGCVAPPGSCVDGTATCDGATAIVCEQGEQVRVACDAFASHCVIDTTGRYSCVPDASDCAAQSADTCIGNSLEMCANGSRVATPCTDLGLTTCTAGSNATCN